MGVSHGGFCTAGGRTAGGLPGNQDGGMSNRPSRSCIIKARIASKLAVNRWHPAAMSSSSAYAVARHQVTVNILLFYAVFTIQWPYGQTLLLGHYYVIA